MAFERGNISRYSVYQTIFPEGTAHHAAELGSIQALLKIEAAQQEQGYPSHVTLSSRDDILQCTPLHVAAEKGQLEMVQYLVDHQVDIDAADVAMVRPLHLAAINSHTAVLKLLMDRGANPTKQDSDGDVPLHWAATKGHVEVMEMLLDKGVAVDQANKAGWTALHRAAYTSRVPACRLLLQRGASIHALTHDGRTPLHLAALQHHLGVMELLLGMSAATHFRDKRGATASDLCIHHTAWELIQEQEAARAASKAGSAAAADAVTKQQTASDTSCAAASTATNQAVTGAASMTRVPRFRKVANVNLDADGFPIAVDAQGDTLQPVSSADLATHDLPTIGELEPGEYSEYLAPATEASQMSAFRRSSVGGQSMGYFAQAQQRASMPGQLSADNSGSQRGYISAAGDSTAAHNWGGAELQQQPSRQELAFALLSPSQKPAAFNKRFLEQYNLHKMGLFAP